MDYKLPKTIETTIKKDFEKKLKPFLSEINRLNIEVEKLRAEVAINTVQSSLDAKISLSKTTFDTLDSLLRENFGRTFYNNPSGAYTDDLMVFMLHMLYYNNRFEVYSILDAFGIQYSPYLKKVISPHEWNKEQLLAFLKIVDNNRDSKGLCNDIATWYHQYEENLVSPHYQMKSENQWYAEIPWELILRNPLWSDKELFEGVIEALTIRYGCNFFDLLRFCKALSPEQERALIIERFKFDNIDLFLDNHKEKILKLNDPEIYSLIVSSGAEAEPWMPDEVKENHALVLPYEQAVKYIRNNFSSEEKKKELIVRVTQKEYSDIAILDRLSQHTQSNQNIKVYR